MSQATLGAYPTNFHLDTCGTAPIGNGWLECDYSWDSSSNYLTDLADCDLGEYVTSDLGTGSVWWPKPPWNWNQTYPIISWPWNGTWGNAPNADYIKPGAFQKPYKAVQFTDHQKLRYQCVSVNNGQPVVLAGPISITRSVAQNSDGTWAYTAYKSGFSVSINPLP